MIHEIHEFLHIIISRNDHCSIFLTLALETGCTRMLPNKEPETHKLKYDNSFLQDRIYRQYVLEAMRSSERLRNSVSGNNAAAGGAAASNGQRASGVPNVCLMARNRKEKNFPSLCS